MIFSENRYRLFGVMRRPCPADRYYPDRLLSRVGLSAILGAGGLAGIGGRGLLFHWLLGLFGGPIAGFLPVAHRLQLLFRLDLLFFAHGRGRARRRHVMNGRIYVWR